MPNIKEVVDRIGSVASTQQITKAMKMVAAAKLSKVQQQVLQMRPYADRLVELLGNVTASAEEQFAGPYLDQRPVDKVLLVVMTSDRGLCGSFNANVLKRAMGEIDVLMTGVPDRVVTVLPVGQKAMNFFQKRGLPLLKDYVSLLHRLDFQRATEAATFLADAFLGKDYDRVLLVYNQFQNAATQVPAVEQLLPFVQADLDEGVVASDYIYSPSQKDLLETLIPQVLHVQFYKALLESSASEHGARMTTMSKATDNADELLKTLRLTYNRTRQAVITREISEIVAGTDALSGV